MKNLNKFIIEKFKINKNTKFSSLNDCYIVFAASESYFKCLNKFKEYMIEPPAKIDICILHSDDIINEFKDTIDNITIYKIPNKYHTFEEIKNDYLNNPNFHLSDLTIVDFEDINKI